MDLRFRTGSGAMVTAPAADCGPRYRGLARTRRLVVLGDAGSGKTLLVSNLILGLVADLGGKAGEQSSNTRVPVRASLASWNGNDTFSDWVCQRLSIDYGLRKNVARALLDARRILPVLDGGLDEMDPSDGEPVRADRALHCLNKSGWVNQPVIVTCRTDVFHRLQELRGDGGLHAANVITLQPLTPVEVNERLLGYRVDQFGITDSEAWAPVTDQIRNHPRSPLAMALRSPWLLSLTASALRRGTPNAVQLSQCSSPAEVRDALFSALIPAATSGERTRSTRAYTKHNVEIWLHALATHLECQRRAGLGGDQIRLDQAWQLTAWPSRILHGSVVGLVVAATVWFVVGPDVGAVPRIAEAVLAWIVWGLLGTMFMSEIRGTIHARRLAWRVPDRTRWPHAVATGALAGLAVGMMTGLMSTAWSGHAVGIKAGLAFGLAGGLVAGFWDGLSTTSDDRLALGQDAHRIIRDDAAFAVGVGIVLWISFTIALGAVLGVVDALKTALPLGIPSVLMIMASFGIASGRYASATTIFAFTRQFPSRPADFFEWARSAGLLRVNGPAYQFRHGTYQHWLATSGVDNGLPAAQRSGASTAEIS